jgi:hypothetical protein
LQALIQTGRPGGLLVKGGFRERYSKLLMRRPHGERRSGANFRIADDLDALHEHALQFFIHKAANPPVPFIVLAVHSDSLFYDQ